jgi:hypothetical protein
MAARASRATTVTARQKTWKTTLVIRRRKIRAALALMALGVAD